MRSGEGMQPTADWWKVSIEDIRTANEERRNRWHNLVDHVPYRRSELERLKRIATANLPPGQFFIADFDTLVSGYGEQYGRWYIQHEAEGWVPDFIKAEEYLIFRGIPASAVAAAFAHAMCAAQSMPQVQRSRGRPGWRAFRCWVGLLAEAWWDRLYYHPTVTHEADDDRRGTENERFGRFPEFVEGWVEWARSHPAPAESWWPPTKSARAHMIDAVLKELRGRRKPIKGGPFAAYQKIKIFWSQFPTIAEQARQARVPTIAKQARQARGGGSDCPLCRMLHIDRCRRKAVPGSHG
jgi:hypothetical protein